MIADILHAFPSFTYDYIMRQITFKQFILWHMQALRVLHGIEVNLNDNINIDKELERINNNFVWNEEEKRWE